MPLTLVGIDHIQVAVPKTLERECPAVYRAVFGFPETENPEQLRHRGGVWFQVRPLQLRIGIDQEPSPGSKRHLCFLVESLAEARAHRVACTVPIEEQREAEGLTRLFFRDPAGNRFEFGRRI